MADRGTDYDARFAELAASGKHVHGEADLVEQLIEQLIRHRPATVLDAGCGTGRVAIELARRGYRTIGIDADLEMIETARRKAPDLLWHHADLALGALGSLGITPSSIDVVVAAGNVMIFLRPGTLEPVLRALGEVLHPDGLLVAGFSLDAPRPLGATLGIGRPNPLDLATYDEACHAAGLRLERRLATWDGAPYAGASYAVSVHRRTDPPPVASDEPHPAARRDPQPAGHRAPRTVTRSDRHGDPERDPRLEPHAEQEVRRR